MKFRALVFALFLAAGCATTRPHLGPGPKAYWANVQVQRHINAAALGGIKVTVWILATVVNPTNEAVVIDCNSSLTTVPPHTEQDILTFPREKCDLRNDTLYPSIPLSP